MTETIGFSNKKALWRMYIDGAIRKTWIERRNNSDRPKKIKIEYTIRIAYGAINNAAEYEALIMGLKLVNGVRAKSL